MPRGGKREGAGRKKGATSYLTSKDLMDEFEKRGLNPAEELINIYLEYSNNGMLENKEGWMRNFSKYLFQAVPTKDEIDLTSNGETMAGMFVIKKEPDERS